MQSTLVWWISQTALLAHVGFVPRRCTGSGLSDRYGNLCSCGLGWLDSRSRTTRGCSIRQGATKEPNKQVERRTHLSVEGPVCRTTRQQHFRHGYSLHHRHTWEYV
uniref:Putative secreted protein n=1 Tax=Ixodes ricinus TaxID=34613 RepID=A0A6B0UI06_IXORI